MTLDSDVLKKISEKVRESGKSAKEVYNDLLRAALANPAPKRATKKFKLPVFKGKKGLLPGFSWDMSAAQILDRLDEEEFSTPSRAQSAKKGRK